MTPPLCWTIRALSLLLVLAVFVFGLQGCDEPSATGGLRVDPCARSLHSEACQARWERIQPAPVNPGVQR